MNIPKLSVSNPVSVNLIMIFIIVAGITLYSTQMPKELFPAFSKNQILVTTMYPGVSAEEIEKEVTIKIEDAIRDLDDVDEIYSTSQEGRSTVRVVVSPDIENISKITSDIRQSIEEIEEFPEDAENPIIKDIVADYPIITVSLYGNINLLRLKDAVEDIKDNISVLPGVADVKVSGLPEREFWINVNPESLEQYDLSMSQITSVIRANNYDLPGGTIPTDQGEFLIRTIGKAVNPNELTNLIVKTTQAGSHIVLGDIASLKNWFARETSIGRFNMARAVNINITKTQKGDVIKIADTIRELVKEYSDQLPITINMGVFNDYSIYVKNRLNILKVSGTQGLIIVFFLLFFMLNLRVSIMVTIGIPISFLGAIIIMNFTGMTMNMVAMFAFIVVLGMVVDDAIVIGENIYRHYEKGVPVKEAAVKGTLQVSRPVISAILTTIAAFIPLLLMPGTMGKFMGVIPKVVIFALSISLLEALLILPSHMAEFLPQKPPQPHRMRLTINNFINSVIEKYGDFLSKALKWRYVTITIMIAFSTIIVAYAIFHVPFVLFHEFEGSQFFLNVEMPTNKSLEDTENFTERVEDAIKRVISAEELTSLVTNVGYIFDDIDSFRTGSNIAQIIVELKELDKGRKKPVKTIVKEVRDSVAPLQRFAKLHIKELHAGPAGLPIYVEITGSDPKILKKIASEIKKFIIDFPGVYDLRDNFEAGKPEIQVRLKPYAYNLGLNDRTVALEIRNAFWGMSGSRYQTRTEDIDIVVKLPELQRAQLSTLLDYKITLPDGEKIPLREVADVIKAKGISKIMRSNSKRSIIVTGNLDQSLTTSKDLATAVQEKFKTLSKDHPGYYLSVEKGEMKDINESLTALKTAFLIALVLIYFILGTQFKSYIQPIVVMAAIPFGINGVIIGHAIMGKSLGLLSFIGLVALSGIVVNDSLILVDFINKLRETGVNRIESIINSAKLRLRPVVLTSATTMGGLFMLTFFAKGQAKFLSPMAVSMFWGLMFSTTVILLLVPCLYAILDDLSIKTRRQRTP